MPFKKKKSSNERRKNTDRLNLFAADLHLNTLKTGSDCAAVCEPGGVQRAAKMSDILLWVRTGCFCCLPRIIAVAVTAFQMQRHFFFFHQVNGTADPRGSTVRIIKGFTVDFQPINGNLICDIECFLRVFVGFVG